MKYANIDGCRVEAKPGLKGVCSFCNSIMYAKCGREVAWHWSHRSKTNCDPWWENETQWHRDWKAYFPEVWQEVIHRNEETNEKHFADVKNDSGMVLEFQNSPIKPEELESREEFYGTMLWIVNGDRKDTLGKWNFNVDLATRYEVISEAPIQIRLKIYASTRLFARWAKSTVPVYMDFADSYIWRLVSFIGSSNELTVEKIGKREFVKGHGGFWPDFE